MRVAVTGASGVLGRAVTNHFHTNSVPTLPLSFSRTSASPLYPDLPKPTTLDLLDDQAVRDYFTAVQSDTARRIDFLIHCAAERRPDAAEADPERASALNAGSTDLLARLAVELGFGLIYISTDYVFDGKKPPYSVEDAPNPLNLYGRLKRDGEKAVLKAREESHTENGKDTSLVVMRVPLLYGQVEYNSETAVNLFVDILEDQSGKEYTMDDYAVRFPTCVEDVARVIYDLVHLDKTLPSIVHYSSTVGMTKYKQLVIIASCLSLPHGHVRPDDRPPAPDAAVQRPGNTQLSVDGVKEIGVSIEEDQDSFEKWWQRWARSRRA